MASLLIIQGANQGRRFDLAGKSTGLGREHSNTIRLNDEEISRRHAEVRKIDGGFVLVDLNSANGTFLNGQVIEQGPLRSGDQIRVGQTTLVFQESASDVGRDFTARLKMLSPESPEDRSAILKRVPAEEGSRVLSSPELVITDRLLKERLVNLAVMYKASQAISQFTDVDTLLSQVLELVFESIGADRGAILLKLTGSTELIPKSVRWKGGADPDERMSISRTIIDHVLQKGEGVITADAPADDRFGPAQSIVDYGIREAICIPLQGRHGILGVLYADAQASLETDDHGRLKSRFSKDHLMLMVAIGYQAGLAIENAELYQAKIEAERLAAVGQTIATLSHHIKNILQGIRGGSYLIDMGLNDKDEDVVRRGWAIVEKNQTKIYNMVMDMLSFSKEREPALEPSELNETVSDVVELMQSRSKEKGVRLEWSPTRPMPEINIDPDGIHRAVLNIVTNAIDATEGSDGATVRVSTTWDDGTQVARVVVADNGPGIPEGEVEGLFQLFASTKGSRGTGLGLPVSRKIAVEHGGTIKVESIVGQGTTFIFEIPNRPLDCRGSAEAGLATFLDEPTPGA